MRPRAPILAGAWHHPSEDPHYLLTGRALTYSSEGRRWERPRWAVALARASTDVDRRVRTVSLETTAGSLPPPDLPSGVVPTPTICPILA